MTTEQQIKELEESINGLEEAIKNSNYLVDSFKKRLEKLKNPKKQEWKDGGTFFCLNTENEIIKFSYYGSDYTDKLINIKNAFHTEEEAELEQLRREGRAFGDEIVIGQGMWYWNWSTKVPDNISYPESDLDSIFFNTQEKCEEFGRKYAHAFEALIK